MIYLLLFIMVVAYDFIRMASGLFEGTLFCIIFLIVITPVMVENIKKIKSSLSFLRFCLGILFIITTSSFLGILFFHWLLK